MHIPIANQSMKNRTKWLIYLVTDIRQFVKPGQPAQYKTQHKTRALDRSAQLRQGESGSDPGSGSALRAIRMTSLSKDTSMIKFS